MLDQAFLRPKLIKVSPDWLRLGLEMTSSLLEHILGGSLALLVCSRIFDFGIMPTLGWAVVGGMVILFPIIHGTELALRYFRQLKEKEQQEEQLRTLATEAELRALKAQINPHFLFNTLNTIAALIHADPVRAEATVERLAEMFRYVLNGSERGLVPLEEELAFLDVYLEIEHARFGERLRLTREIAPETLGLSVPSLVLQPLVENAIRHGRAGDGSVDLTIRVQPQAKAIVITIADQGPGMSQDYSIRESPGHGLRNVDERLRKTYGEEYRLGFAANAPQGTIVTVKIPAGGKE
jgi:two-component system LytT family sensor kinase